MKPPVTLVPFAALALLLAASSVRADCTVGATPVIFGNYSVLDASPRDSTGTITFTCSKVDKRIRITLTKGASATYIPRRMSNGSDTLEYNLYIDVFATVWGDGSEGTDVYYTHNPPNDKLVSLPVYGRIFAGQDVSAGLYADSIQVQIDF